MAIPQAGIFALGTRSHHHLEFDVHPSVAPGEVAAALARLREPTVTSGAVNVVVGFGAGLWSQLAGSEEAVPRDLVSFAPIDGIDGTGAPATQHDLWVWVHGSGADIALDAAVAVTRSFEGVASLVLEQPCFVYKDSRDLTGFVDGTANPGAELAALVALLPDGEPGAGGSHVLAQRWVHDLRAFDALEEAEQEAVFGRTKPDSVELAGAAKLPTAHISRVEIADAAGEERPIYRRSTPFGTVDAQGLYFLAFSADRSRFDAMLARMFGVEPDGDGLRDRLTDFSRPTTGSYYFAPSIDALNDVLTRFAVVDT